MTPRQYPGCSSHSGPHFPVPLAAQPSCPVRGTHLAELSDGDKSLVGDVRQSGAVGNVIADHRRTHRAPQVGAAVLRVRGDPLMEQKRREAGHGGDGEVVAEDVSDAAPSTGGEGLVTKSLELRDSLDQHC